MNTKNTMIFLVGNKNRGFRYTPQSYIHTNTLQTRHKEIVKSMRNQVFYSSLILGTSVRKSNLFGFYIK